MPRPPRDAFMRHEPAVEVVRKKVTTQRNLKSPIRPEDLEETFGSVGSVRESAVVQVPRDRTPKGVTDGRGKRSVKDVLMSHPTPEAKSVYALERVASLEDQIVKLLELCGPEVREIIFKRRASLKQYWDEDTSPYGAE